MDASEPVVSTQRLGALTSGQIQTALDRFSLGRFVRAEPASDGLFGQNVFVTSDTGEYVLRGAPHYDWQFPTERFFAQLLHERTVAPTPWPYLLDPTDDIFGWSYVLMPRMPGHSFTDSAWFATLSMDDRLSIASALGETLADLHALTWPFAGAYDAREDQVIPFPGGYGAWVIERIEGFLVEALAYPNHTPPDDTVWARDLIARGRDALAIPFQPCVVMEDYHPGNVTITGEDGRWRVSGVFDLMTLRFGDGEADLARLGRMYAYEEPRLAKAFICAYLDRRPPRPGFAQRFPIYLLHDSLIIWAFCLRNNDIWWPEGYTLRSWVEETLEILRAQGLFQR
jgi:hygromycin-B 7''-O-kinase